MDARKQPGVLMVANRDIDAPEVNRKYYDGDLCQIMQKMDIEDIKPIVEPDRKISFVEETDSKAAIERTPEVYEMSKQIKEKLKEADQCGEQRMTGEARKEMDDANTLGKLVPRQGPASESQPSKFTAADVRSELKPVDICQSSLGTPLFPESMEEMMFGKFVTDDHTRILRPGMVLLKNYMSLDDQAKIVRSCRLLGLGEGGFYQPGYANDDKRRLHRMYLGRYWDSQTKIYSELRNFDGARPPPVPDSFISLTERAIEAAQVLINAEFNKGSAVDILPDMHPNLCIINFYNTNGRLHLHQDKSESRESLEKGLPVVSISLGDSAIFVYGDNNNTSKAEKVLLESGDVLIFGGSSRLIYHGVHSIIPNSAPAALQQATGLRPGRLSLTFREF